MKHRLQQKNYFSFHSLAKVRGWKSRNEQKQQYHTLNAFNINFAMTILAISENQGQNFNFCKKTTFYISVGQNSRTMFSKKKQQVVLSLDFPASIICI